jgi:hypothetical protein
MRPGVSYLITIALDPWMEITGPIVRTLVMRSGHTASLPHYRNLVEGTLTEMVDIGGTIRDPAREGLPAPGIQVAVKGTGLFTSSDEQGRFILGSLPPGEYTLVAWPSKGKPKEKKVSIPAPEGNYDIDL